MSEYTPITGELRDAMETDEQCGDLFGINYLRISEGRLCRLCDAIDAIHAQLERENAALKVELDRVLGEQEDSRGCIYYDPERHYCSCHDIDTDGLVELPKDADGVPIRLGDGLADTSDKFHCGKAHIIELKEDGWIVFVGSLGRRPQVYRHVKPDTWERIIEDAIGEGMERQRNNDSGNFCERANPMNNGDLVARCKALCERTKEDE